MKDRHNSSVLRVSLGFTVACFLATGYGCEPQGLSRGSNKAADEPEFCSSVPGSSDSEMRFPNYGQLDALDFFAPDKGRPLFFGNSPEVVSSVRREGDRCLDTRGGGTPSTSRLLVTTDPGASDGSAIVHNECADWSMQRSDGRSCEDAGVGQQIAPDCPQGGVKRARVHLVYINETGGPLTFSVRAAPVSREATLDLVYQGAPARSGNWDAEFGPFRANSFDHFIASDVRKSLTLEPGVAMRVIETASGRAHEVARGATIEVDFTLDASECVQLYALAEHPDGGLNGQKEVELSTLRSNLHPVTGREYRSPAADQVLACEPRYQGSEVSEPSQPAGGRAAGLYRSDACEAERPWEMKLSEGSVQGFRLFDRDHARACTGLLAGHRHASDFVDGLYGTTTEVVAKLHNDTNVPQRIRWAFVPYPGMSEDGGPSCPGRIVNTHTGWSLNGVASVCSGSSCSYVRTVLSRAFWQSPIPIDGLGESPTWCAGANATRQKLDRVASQGGTAWNDPSVPGFDSECSYLKTLAPGTTHEVRLRARLPTWSSAPVGVVAFAEPSAE